MPPGTITNFGAFDKNLSVSVRYIDGYPVSGPPIKEVPLGMFVFDAIVEDAIMAYGGSAVMATRTGARIARLTSIVLKSAARAAKMAKTTARGTKLAKQATTALKNAKSAIKKAVPKSSVAKRAEIYKAQGYQKYTESQEVKDAFNQLEELASKSEEFREVLKRVYDAAKRGTQQGVKARNARLRSPNPGWDHSKENEKYVFDKYNITPEFVGLLEDDEEYEEPKIQTSREFYYKQDLEERERVRKWREEGKLTFTQPTFTKEEKLANEERQAVIDEQNKRLAMQITGRDENYNYIYPSKKDISKDNTPTNTSSNTPTNTSSNTPSNNSRNTPSNTPSNTSRNVPITSNTAVTHIAKTKQTNNWIDQRDYNNFNFNNQTPSVNQDWLQVNQNNVENIDGEKLQNYVEDN
jgi:hypothetical protein